MNARGSQPQTQERHSRDSPPPGPFGFIFDAGPAPPPGPSLLDDSESNMLDNFFTTLNTGQLDVRDNWFNAVAPDKGGSSFGMDWAEELPPNFEGSATSLSQAPAFSYNNAAKGTNSLMGGLGPDSDILAAASMLYANGMSSNSYPTQNISFHNVLADQNGLKQEQSHHRLEGINSAGSHQPLVQPQHTSVFHVDQPVPVDPQTTTHVRTLRWGSDAGFVDQGYLRPSNVPSGEQQTLDLLDTVNTLIPTQSTSATNTRAPSPARTTENIRSNSLNESNTSHLTPDSRDMDSRVPPKKRFKTKSQIDDYSDETGTPPRTKRPKSSSGGKFRRGSSEASSRKQTNKPTRENLSEEQKRTNHILSEQKRRNLIKNGFDELCSLVPELRGGGFSKSAMLIQAADYLDEVLEGNEVLRQQLNQLRSLNGFFMQR
ncbi:hypothetical protein BGW36DRAFT_422253 [Talaromyces proteolyticus]|uniref:BHLH domain-containing protein n=1 Tax=Talaromyces proteolyticus TaxID=1131652 RepID=A0AAD4L337_9EURO|nr:uncharacterized protein BGW36DRAFT_422253 [Talaromyces proteolyticus]KAH8705711.1 hypothetical protein BGW36DRAFT_422253 [Talaromyces proteolyticus]